MFRQCAEGSRLVVGSLVKLDRTRGRLIRGVRIAFGAGLEGLGEGDVCGGIGRCGEEVVEPEVVVLRAHHG